MSQVAVYNLKNSCVITGLLKTSVPRKRASRRAYEALRGTGVAADVLVWSLQSFESRLNVACSLPATIQREGRLLYAA